MVRHGEATVQGFESRPDTDTAERPFEAAADEATRATARTIVFRMRSSVHWNRKYEAVIDEMDVGALIPAYAVVLEGLDDHAVDHQPVSCVVGQHAVADAG